MNRYPRRGRVVMTRGRSASSLSTARIRRHQSQKKLYRLSVSDISVDDIAMPTAANRVPDDLQHLLPLTPAVFFILRSEEHTSELQSLTNLVCRLLLEKKKTKK